MRLIDTIRRDLKEAMKEHNKASVLVLRSLLAEIKIAEIEEGRKEEGLDDVRVVKIILKEIKKRAEAASQYRAGEREESAQEEEAEEKKLREYVPDLASRQQIEETVKEIIKRDNPQDEGIVIRESMKALKGRALGGEVKEVVRFLLKGG